MRPAARARFGTGMSGGIAPTRASLADASGIVSSTTTGDVRPDAGDFGTRSDDVAAETKARQKPTRPTPSMTSSAPL